MSNASLSDVIFLCRATDDGGITSSVVDVSSIEARNISASGDSGVFGGSCFYFNGNAFITTPISDQSWVNSDFTIDWWEKPDESTSGTRFTTLFCDTYASQAGGLLVGVVDGTAPNFMTFASTTYGGTSNWNLMNSQVSGSNIVNVWTHRAVIREGTNLKFYCNGNLEYTFAIGSTLGYNNSRPFAIGAWAEDFRNTGYTFTGYIDEFRVTRKAVWTSNFTVPSARYTGGEFGEEANIGAGLPSDYQEVEYLQSSGTQYIDTGFIPNQDSRIVCDFALSDIMADGTNNLFGSRNITSSKAFTFGTSSGCWRFGYNTSSAATSLAADTNRHVSDINRNICYLDGEAIDTRTAATFTGYASAYVGAIHASGTGYNSYARFYSCQVYDNDTLVRDFVPCYRKSDNVAGLYDKVNGVFYTNAGTGTFTVGPDVVGNVEPVILSVPINFFEAMLRRRLIAVMQKFALIVNGIEYHSGDTITITSSTTVSVIGSGSIHVSVVGAGGGGGGGDSYGTSSTGGGGGSGGLSQDTINVNKGSYSVIVGVGGKAGTNSIFTSKITSGSKGGDTSAFGLSATGGYGGNKTSSSGGTGTNGQAGTGTTSNGNTAQTGGTSVYNGYGKGGAGSKRGSTPSSGGNGVCVIVIN